MLVAMRCALFLALFLAVAFAGEVPRFQEGSTAAHIIRSLDQRFLNPDAELRAGDVVVAEGGDVRLKIPEGTVRLGAGGRLQLLQGEEGFVYLLMEGAMILEGESEWRLRLGQMSFRGRGIFYVEQDGKDCEAFALRGSVDWTPYPGFDGVLLPSGTRARLDSNRVMPRYARKIQPLEGALYRESFLPAHQREAVLLDLDGEPYRPLTPLVRAEAQRRRDIDEGRAKDELISEVQGEFAAKEKEKAMRSLRETVQEDVGFEFPVPFAPPPRSKD